MAGQVSGDIKVLGCQVNLRSSIQGNTTCKEGGGGGCQGLTLEMPFGGSRSPYFKPAFLLILSALPF